MHLFAVFAAIVLAGFASASNLAQVCKNQRACTLNITSKDKNIDGRMLYIRKELSYYKNSKDGRIRAFSNVTGPVSTAWTNEFQAAVYPYTGTLTLWPISGGVEQMGLLAREPGLLTLVNLNNPTDAKVAADKKKAEWSVFTINPTTNRVGVDDKTNVRGRKWVAYVENGYYFIALTDGLSKSTRNLIDIKIAARPS